MWPSWIPWALLIGSAGVVQAGCEDAGAPLPRAVVVKPSALAVPGPTRCQGGLLCEAAATLNGWRVPDGCVGQRPRGRVQTCRLVGADRQRLDEFYRSRYAHVDASPTGFVVGPEPAVPLPATSTAASQVGEAAERGLLVLRLDPEGCDLTAIFDTGG